MNKASDTVFSCSPLGRLLTPGADTADGACLPCRFGDTGEGYKQPQQSSKSTAPTAKSPATANVLCMGESRMRGVVCAGTYTKSSTSVGALTMRQEDSAEK
jgi:hypothetical protein